MALTKDDVETRPEAIYREPGDAEKLAHYYEKKLYDIARSAIEGTPIKALCGKVWIPTRDPEKFPICPQCQAIVDYRSVD